MAARGVGRAAAANAVARKLSVFRSAVYATPRYVERFGEPLHPDDLIHHRALALTTQRGAQGFTWTLGEGNDKLGEFPVEPVLVAKTGVSN